MRTMRSTDSGLNVKCLDMFGCEWVSIRSNQLPPLESIHSRPPPSTVQNHHQPEELRARPRAHGQHTQYIVAWLLQNRKMYVAGDRRGHYLWIAWICRSCPAGRRVRSGDAEPPRGPLVAEVGGLAVEDQQTVGDCHEPISEAARGGRGRGTGQDGQTLVSRERLEQAAHGRRLRIIEAGVDLADGERLGLADERARDSEPRLIDRAERGRELDLAPDEPDALERAPCGLALRLARQAQEALNRALAGAAAHQHVPEQRAVGDGARVDIGLGDQPADTARRVARDGDAIDPDATFFGDDPGRDGIEQRVTLLGQVRDDQGHLAAPEACADTMKPPATVLARGPDSEQLDHGAHDPRGSLRIDDGNMNFALAIQLRALLQQAKAVAPAPTGAPAIGGPETPILAPTSHPAESAWPSRCRPAERRGSRRSAREGRDRGPGTRSRPGGRGCAASSRPRRAGIRARRDSGRRTPARAPRTGRRWRPHESGRTVRARRAEDSKFHE